jgi:hypothetical protein
MKRRTGRPSQIADPFKITAYLHRTTNSRNARHVNIAD